MSKKTGFPIGVGNDRTGCYRPASCLEIGSSAILDTSPGIITEKVFEVIGEAITTPIPKAGE